MFMQREPLFRHTLIKVLGVTWVLIFFWWFLSGVDSITNFISDSSPMNDPKAMPIGLAVFHSLFNLVNSFILIGFVPWIAKLAEWFIPSKSNTDEKFSLKYFGLQFSSSELIFLEAKKEIASFALRGRKQFNRIPELLIEKDEQKYKQLSQVIKDQEEAMDTSEDEINAYLNQVYQGELSENGLKKVKSMQRIVKELENVGDSVYHMAKSIDRKNKEKAWFAPDQRDNLKKMFDLMYTSFDVLIENLEKDYDKVSLDKAQMLELQINKLRSDLMKEHFEKANSPEYNNKSSIIYIDLIAVSEKMADHIYNINEAILGLK